ncbi:MAG: hypothetical protein ACI97K_000885 [Glaciecola sp.]
MHVYLYSTTVCTYNMDIQTASAIMNSISMNNISMNSIDMNSLSDHTTQASRVLNNTRTIHNPTLAVSNLHHTAFELQPTQPKKSRWAAHVSLNTKLSSNDVLVLNVKPTKTMSCFDIIERLLFAKTCDVIYTDEALPLHQVRMLKQMSLFSGTEIVFISDSSEFNHLHSDDLEKA